MPPVDTAELIELPYSLISIIGPDADKLLQGQTSCDVEKLELKQTTLGTANTPKGRMYALFKVMKTEDGFWLRIHEAIADQFVQQLSKYAVFFKCEIKLEADYKVYGQYQLSSQVISDISEPPTTDFAETKDKTSVHLVSNDPKRFEIWCASGILASESISMDKLERWLAEDTLAGIPELYPETLDSFILQYLNLQDLGAVSFNKGCYTGQEIIARMKFLGKLKKKTFLLQAQKDEEALPGQTIYDTEGKKCGELVRKHFTPEQGLVALGILDLSYADSDAPIFLAEDCRSPLTVTEINYN